MMIRTTRKSFLRGLGAAAVAGPFLRMIERRGEAAALRKLVIMATPNGTVMSSFWPGTGCAYGPILKPLEPLRKKLLVMRGIDMKSALKAPVPRDHLPDFANALIARQPVGNSFSNNQVTGISIDQHIANTVGNTTKFASIALNVGPTASAYPLLASGAGRPITPNGNPQKAFDQLFSNLPVPGGMPMGASPVDPAIERLRADRASLLGNLRQELGDVRCQLGAPERLKFDAHVDALHELEKSLSFTSVAVGAGCKKPPTPPTAGDFPTVGAAQIKNVVAALACERTRVAVLAWSHGGSGVSHTWAGATGSHHGISHNTEGVNATGEVRLQWLVNIDTWYAKRMYDLCQALDGIPEGAGTMLDNTAVLWIHEQSNGASHQRTDMPYVLAGGCGGAFRTGRCLQFKGVAHNGLLISLAEAMGVPTPSFGDPEFSSGPLADL